MGYASSYCAVTVAAQVNNERAGEQGIQYAPFQNDFRILNLTRLGCTVVPLGLYPTPSSLASLPC